MRRILSCSLALVGVFLVNGRAELRLPGLFSEGMVLQRDREITVWGETDDAGPVTVRFNGVRQDTTPAGGRWRVTLPAAPAGGPYRMLVSSGAERCALDKVYVGDVWLFTGGTAPAVGTAAPPPADLPPMSLFMVPHCEADTPVSTTTGSWRKAAPAAAGKSPTMATAFGRALQQALGVPVGLIVSAPYPCRIDSWLSDTTPELEVVERIDAYYQASYEAKLRDQQEKVAEAKEQGKPAPKNRVWAPRRPHVLYNGMIAPLTPYGIRGIAWSQGAADKFHAVYHERLLTQLVRDWRRDWRSPDLPFLLIQLPAQRGSRGKRAPSQSQFAELRDAALGTSRALPRAGLVVTADLGYPPDWNRVGQRLATVALGVAYGGGGEHSAAVFEGMEVKGADIALSFGPATVRLGTMQDELTGFSVARHPHRFEWAQGVIRGTQVTLTCPAVKAPVTARYGWSDAPQLSLVDGLGLPLSPFRTDDFPTLLPWDRTVVYGTVNGHKLGAFLFLPWHRHPKPCPVVIFIHGGGWRSGTPYAFTWHAHKLAAQGFAALSIGYRLSQQAIFPACLEDAKCAVRWVRAHADTFGFDPDRIGVVGQSAGAHIAALLATTPDISEFDGSGGHQDQSSAVQAAVLINGVYEFTSFWKNEALHGFRTIRMCVPELIGKPFDEAPALYERASPIRYVSSTAPPCLLFHSRPDDVVPLSEAVNFHRRLQERGAPMARLELSDEGGHGWAMGSHANPCYKMMQTFLLEQLGTRAQPEAGDR